MVDEQEINNGLKLIYAEYFYVFKDRTIIKRDVTKLLNNKISDKNILKFYVSNNELGGDFDSEGNHKTLYVKYLYNGVEFEDTQQEWHWIEIPNKNNQLISSMREKSLSDESRISEKDSIMNINAPSKGVAGYVQGNQYIYIYTSKQNQEHTGVTETQKVNKQYEIKLRSDKTGVDYLTA